MTMFQQHNIHTFTIIYLLTQIQNDIMYRKTVFEREFLRFLMYKNK